MGKPVFIQSNLNYSDIKSAQYYNAKGYCTLLTVLLIDIVNRNFLMNDVLNSTKNPPEIPVMTEYLKKMMKSIENYFNNMKELHFWIFLCNYARLVTQDILLPDEKKSLDSYNFKRRDEVYDM